MPKKCLMVCISVFFIAFIGGCKMEKQKMIEEGVHKIPPSLPNLLEPQRNELEQELVTVRKHLKNFAVQND